MTIYNSAENILSFITSRKNAGKSVGFVPTMGALHNGHISLIMNSREQCDITVASIFVNPTQFNNAEDLKKYPRTIEKDLDLLESSGCNVLFLPSVGEMYPEDFVAPYYNLGQLDKIYEGASRPGHFQGVCQVVDRLLKIVQPDYIYMGQKDLQQCLVIKKLVDITSSDTKVVVSPTLRELSGLAMSSRNMRLNNEALQKAAAINDVLEYVAKNIQPGNVEHLKDYAYESLTAGGFNVDYFDIAETDDLVSVRTWDGKTKIAAVVAAYIDGVRLIDNMLLN